MAASDTPDVPPIPVPPIEPAPKAKAASPKPAAEKPAAEKPAAKAPAATSAAAKAPAAKPAAAKASAAPAAPAAAPAAPPHQPNPYAQSAPAPTPPPYAPNPYAPAPQGLSITSMVLGIVAVLLSFCYGAGFLFGIGAVVTGHLATKREPHAKPFWLTGVITGYVGIGISLIWGIGIIIFFAWTASMANNYTY